SELFMSGELTGFLFHWEPPDCFETIINQESDMSSKTKALTPSTLIKSLFIVVKLYIRIEINTRGIT
ncbi:MAG TPA: hypothetical protein PLI73_05200, partial [Candidatus Cloacimonadota bacterium]|nr:hypothetical protein [Candidatus Cloacimonadota bacterium]